MITIKLRDWKHNKVDVSSIAGIMLAKLKDAGILSKHTLGQNVIMFDKVTDNKYFTSRVDNKINMSPTDKRRKTMDRDYLLTKRLTEDQYGAVIDSLLGTLSNLKIDSDVLLEDTMWRSGHKNYIENVFKPIKFAVKG